MSLICNIRRHCIIVVPVETLNSPDRKPITTTLNVFGWPKLNYKVTCIPNNNGYISVSVVTDRLVNFSVEFDVLNTSVSKHIAAEPVENYNLSASYTPQLITCDKLISHETLRNEGALRFPIVEIKCHYCFSIMSDIRLPKPPSNSVLFGDRHMVKLIMCDASYDVNRFLLRAISKKFRAELSHNIPNNGECYKIENYRKEIVERCMDLVLGRKTSDTTLRQVLKMQKFSREYVIIGLTQSLEKWLAKHISLRNYTQILSNAMELNATELLHACGVFIQKNDLYRRLSFDEKSALKYNLDHPPVDVYELPADGKEEVYDESKSLFLNTLRDSLPITVKVNQGLDCEKTLSHKRLTLDDDFDFHIEHDIECTEDGEQKVSFYLIVNQDIMIHYCFKAEDAERGRSRCIDAVAFQRNYICTILLGDRKTPFEVKFVCEFEFANKVLCNLPAQPPNFELVLRDKAAIGLSMMDPRTEKMNRDLARGISPYFCELFKDPKTSGVHLKEVKNFETLVRSVRFILGQSLSELTVKEMMEILYFAHLYKIDGLKAHLEQWLDDNLSFELYFEVADYAKFADSTKLKKRCAHFFSMQQINMFHFHPDFASLSPDMLQYIASQSVADATFNVLPEKEFS